MMGSQALTTQPNVPVVVVPATVVITISMIIVVATVQERPHRRASKHGMSHNGSSAVALGGVLFEAGCMFLLHALIPFFLRRDNDAQKAPDRLAGRCHISFCFRPWLNRSDLICPHLRPA